MTDERILATVTVDVGDDRKSLRMVISRRLMIEIVRADNDRVLSDGRSRTSIIPFSAYELTACSLDGAAVNLAGLERNTAVPFSFLPWVESAGARHEMAINTSMLIMMVAADSASEKTELLREWLNVIQEHSVRQRARAMEIMRMVPLCVNWVLAGRDDADAGLNILKTLSHSDFDTLSDCVNQCALLSVESRAFLASFVREHELAQISSTAGSGPLPGRRL